MRAGNEAELFGLTGDAPPDDARSTVTTCPFLEGWALDASPDFRITLLAAPSPGSYEPEWHSAVFIPGYSGGTVADSHRVPRFSKPA
jgi:hypothetical protein